MASHHRLHNNGPTADTPPQTPEHKKVPVARGRRGFLQFQKFLFCFYENVLMNGFISVMVISDGGRGGSPDRSGQENHDDFIRRRRNWRCQIDWRNFGYYGQGAKSGQVAHRYRHGTSMRFDPYSLKAKKKKIPMA